MNRFWTIYAALLVVGIGILAIPAPRVQAADPTPAPTSAYVGSATCKGCHRGVADAWEKNPHRATLATDGLAKELTGCEACHGPAGMHLAKGANEKPRVPAVADQAGVNDTCGTCHFTDSTAKAPTGWQKFGRLTYMRSAHGRKNLSCLSCHTGHGTNEHALTKAADTLCLSCHPGVLEEKPGKKAAYTHMPVAQGQCSLCHAPHGAADGSLVRPDVSDACRQCHDPGEATVSAKHLKYNMKTANCTTCHDAHSHAGEGSGLPQGSRHFPYKAGKCEVCHTKPTAEKPQGGLVKPVKELCSTCHPATKLTPKGDNVHAPVKAGLCTTCHNPHASAQPNLMKGRPAALCLTCHTKVKTQMNAQHKHKVLENNMNCFLCHKPHSAAEKHLLVKDELSLCGQCHKHSFSHPMGKRKDGTLVREPKTGKTLLCNSCHAVHGSKHAAMTTLNKDSDLCLQCHNVNH
jgi:predicted CXXCH cytochrome family protein